MARRQKTHRLPAEAEDVQRRIRRWRETKRNGAPMPGELWAAAASLAREHGLYTIARGLPVDYGALKMRSRALEVDADDRIESLGFVEVDTVPPAVNLEPLGPLVELTRPDGGQMVIRLPGHASLDVAGLVASFCGGGA